MSKECDDCGADGIDLLCICDDGIGRAGIRKGQEYKKANGVKATRKEVSPSKPLKVTLGEAAGLNLTTPVTRSFRHSVTEGLAPLKVLCCRCKDVHDHHTRLNEWGQPIGFKWMAGRNSWCPKGCGYHVTVPYDE